MTNKSTINDVTKEDIKTLKYNECEPENAWKIIMVKELVEVRNDQLRVENFQNDELDEILTFLRTSLMTNITPDSVWVVFHGVLLFFSHSSLFFP